MQKKRMRVCATKLPRFRDNHPNCAPPAPHDKHPPLRALPYALAPSGSLPAQSRVCPYGVGGVEGCEEAKGGVLRVLGLAKVCEALRRLQKSLTTVQYCPQPTTSRTICDQPAPTAPGCAGTPALHGPRHSVHAACGRAGVPGLQPACSSVHLLEGCSRRSAVECCSNIHRCSPLLRHPTQPSPTLRCGGLIDMADHSPPPPTAATRGGQGCAVCGTAFGAGGGGTREARDTADEGKGADLTRFSSGSRFVLAMVGIMRMMSPGWTMVLSST